MALIWVYFHLEPQSRFEFVLLKNKVKKKAYGLLQLTYEPIT